MGQAVRYNAFLIKLIQRFVRLGERVVDFGAGAGSFAPAVAAAGAQVTAVELDRALWTDWLAAWRGRTSSWWLASRAEAPR